MRFIFSVHDFLYGVPTLILIFAVFLTLNLKTGFIGTRKLTSATKAVFLGKQTNSETSPLKAASISLCATVGTGNIVGVAGAVTLGGAGAVFWMWISGVLAMSVKFCEVYLSASFKKSGGAFGYIYRAFGSGKIKTVFCVFGIIAALGIGNLTQTNAAANSAAMALATFNISAKAARLIVGVLFFCLCALLLKRENTAADFCLKFLPVMAISYIFFCGVALVLVHHNLPHVFTNIIRGAFRPDAVTGGAVGSVIITVKSGVARGIFSNEAGLSTAALAYEKSEGNAFKVALPAIFEVFVDTIVLCTLTALVVLSSDTAVYGAEFGAYTTLAAFMKILGERTVYLFCPLVCFFAFSSVIGWGIYARRFCENIRINGNIAAVIYSLFCIIGANITPDIVWAVAEMSSLFMMFINSTALILHRDKLDFK